MVGKRRTMRGGREEGNKEMGVEERRLRKRS